ncbi:hypothetical protein XMIN_1584 [Xanthomonas citri pv. mangiferaeindicae LMG 941]|nr:hypothetical protein XMIN_1584 [Xanthomonas citri pv. mangiferaeindicae LMG 941]
MWSSRRPACNTSALPVCAHVSVAAHHIGSQCWPPQCGSWPTVAMQTVIARAR